MAIIEMKLGNEDNFEIYNIMGTYFIVAINGFFFIQVLVVLLPFLDY